MKVLIISEYLHPQTSGISVRIEYYIKHLRRFGHNVTVYGPHRCKTANRKLFSVPFYFFNEDVRLCFPSFQLYKDIICEHYDMVHIVGPNILLCTIILYLLCKLMGINVCTSYHTNSLAFLDHYYKHPVIRNVCAWWGIYCHYYPTIWLNIPILHPENYTDLKLCCNNFDKGYVLSTGIETNLFQYSENFVKKKIIYVGRMAPEKNLFRLIDLFSLVQNDYSLDLVGFGPTANPLKVYVKENNIKNVRFIGRIDYEHLYKYYQTAQAFLCTSLNESYGFTLLESMSCGTPVIYPKCPAFEKLYKPYFPELEYNLDDENSFLNILKYIEQNGVHLRQSCREYACRYSWDKSTEDLVSIYQKIMSSHSRKQIFQKYNVND